LLAVKGIVVTFVVFHALFLWARPADGVIASRVDRRGGRGPALVIQKVATPIGHRDKYYFYPLDPHKIFGSDRSDA